MNIFYEIIEKLALGKMLKDRCAENNLSHAYLFVSADEKYLDSFCLWFASKILKNEIKVESKTHADLFLIDNSKAISVEDVLPIVSDVFVAPFEAENKVYIIKDFSVMTDEAQNKILKTLEEPPANVVIILGASNVNKILPTILSRVARFDLELLPEQEIITLLKNNGINAETANIVSTCCGGNYTHALKLCGDATFMQLYDLVLEMFLKLNGSKDIMFFESKINLQKISLFEFFDLTISMARDIMALHAGETNLVLNKFKIETLKQCLNDFNFLSLTKIISSAIEARKDLSFNANGQAVLDEFLLKMVEAKVTCKK